MTDGIMMPSQSIHMFKDKDKKLAIKSLTSNLNIINILLQHFFDSHKVVKKLCIQRHLSLKDTAKVSAQITSSLLKNIFIKIAELTLLLSTFTCFNVEDFKDCMRA